LIGGVNQTEHPVSGMLNVWFKSVRLFDVALYGGWDAF